MSKEEQIVQEAEAAGIKALKECVPTPMTVKGYGTYSEGVCGFAWINVKPGTSRFSRFLKETGKGKADYYYGGVTVWVHEGGQSMEMKQAYAKAYANVLISHGIKAIDMSRID
jgi:hypothetical protein